MAPDYAYVVIPSKSLDLVVLLSSYVLFDSVILGVRKQPNVFSLCSRHSARGSICIVLGYLFIGYYSRFTEEKVEAAGPQ